MTCNPRTSRSCAATRRDEPLCVYELLPRSLLSDLCLGHFIGHRTDFTRSIVAGIAGLGVSNDGWERKSTISQEMVVVIALCWPVDDVDSSVVYRSIVLGFGRLLHGAAHGVALTAPCAGLRYPARQSLRGLARIGRTRYTHQPT
jgi:hypothetical protein